MADDVVSNPGAGGTTFRAFDDGTREWPASVPAYVTGGSAGSWTLQHVTLANGLPVNIAQSIAIPVTEGSGNLDALVLSDRMQRRLGEMRLIRDIDVAAYAALRRHSERANLQDRRGGSERGSLR